MAFDCGIFARHSGEPDLAVGSQDRALGFVPLAKASARRHNGSHCWRVRSLGAGDREGPL